MSQHRHGKDRVISGGRLRFYRTRGFERYCRVRFLFQSPSTNRDVCRVDVDAFDDGMRKITAQREDLFAGRAAVGQNSDLFGGAERRLNEAEYLGIAIRTRVVERLKLPRWRQQPKPHQIAVRAVEDQPP